MARLIWIVGVRICGRRIGRIYGRLYAFVENLVRAGQKSGEIRRDLGARELASVVVANHDGTFLEWYRRSPSLNGRNLVRALRSVVIAGVRPPAPARRGPPLKLQFTER